jgi:hypothetical protein
MSHFLAGVAYLTRRCLSFEAIGATYRPAANGSTVLILKNLLFARHALELNMKKSLEYLE